VLLDATDARERQLQVAVHARAGVTEAVRLRLQPVHQDDTHAREGVVVEFAGRRTHHVAPRELLLFERNAPLLKDI
jgi:hypothetical protein